LQKTEPRAGEKPCWNSFHPKRFKLLEEEGSLKHTGHESTGGHNLLCDEMPAEVERNESSWIRITTDHFERSRKLVIKHAQLIPLIVNCYKLLNNLKKLTKIAQN